MNVDNDTVLTYSNADIGEKSYNKTDKIKDIDSDAHKIDNNSIEKSENADSSEIDTIYGRKLRINCFERKYKIVDQKVSFFIVARKELGKDKTEKMLHEDMEIKTFLANYEIESIVFTHNRPNNHCNENVETQKKKTTVKDNFEIVKKEESEATKKRRDIIMNTLKRRELFDSLDLPNEFLVRDYVEALEKNGIKVSNHVMPYDDLRWLAKKGKVEMIKKIDDNGIISYLIIKNTGNDKIESEDNNDKNKEDILPSNISIDRFVTLSNAARRRK